MTVRATILLVFVCGSLLAAAPVPASHELLPTAPPGLALPVLHEHTYKMSGRVRALLLWIGRDDVGSGVIRWRGAGEDLAYELLIGSDPLRAPGKLNKWGYLAEEVRGGECTVVGVISKDSEQRLSDVKAGLATRQDRPFDTIRGRVLQRQAYARVSTLQASNSLTYREADAVLKLAFGDGASAVRQVQRPSGARPGFLTSVAELMRASIDDTEQGKRLTSRTIPYIYGDRVYELRLLDATPMARFERDGRIFEHVIRARFETGRPESRPGSRFELIYGSTGPLAEVPVLISYQPKWWLHVELMLES